MRELLGSPCEVGSGMTGGLAQEDELGSLRPLALCGRESSRLSLSWEDVQFKKEMPGFHNASQNEALKWIGGFCHPLIHHPWAKKTLHAGLRFGRVDSGVLSQTGAT